MTQSNKWFVTPQINLEADTRIFFFPYAGGGPAIFSRWVSDIPSKIEAQIVYYPGRGSRHNEPPMRSITLLVNELTQAIQPLLDKPFVFFGHSLGGTVAFELARSLRHSRLPQPNILFISGCGAPQILDRQPPLHKLPDDDFVSSLKKLNGIPQDVLQNQEMLDIFLPMLRTDFELIETYKYAHDKPLNSPIIALGGHNDPRVRREQLEAWATQTNAHFAAKYFEGNHFFVNAARQVVIETIIGEIASQRS